MQVLEPIVFRGTRSKHYMRETPQFKLHDDSFVSDSYVYFAGWTQLTGQTRVRKKESSVDPEVV